MRTTLTVDDDLIGLIKEKAKRRGVSFKAVVNETLRAGLGIEMRQTSSPPKVVPHSFGFQPGIDQTKLGQLVDELEAEAFADSWRQQIEDLRKLKNDPS